MFKENTKLVLIFFLLSISILVLVSISSLLHTSQDKTLYISVIVFVILIILISSYRLGLTLKKLTTNLESVNNYNEELETILNTSSDGIIITNLRGDFLFLNNSFLELTNSKEKGHIYNNLFELLDKNSKKEVENSLKQITNEIKISGIEGKLILDDKEIYVNISLSMMPDNLRVLISLANTTKLNQQHEKIIEIQSRLASIGEMTAAIGHQWRQPLNSINMLISALRFEKTLGTLDDVKEEDYFTQINTQVSHMDQTLKDFKGFIQDKEEFDNFLINDTLKNAINLTQPSLLKYSIVIQDEYQENIYLTSNESAILQSLINLIHNAKDAIKDKIDKQRTQSLNVIIISLLKGNHNSVIIKVKDSGGGIEKENIDKIFDILFTTKNQHGTGLGLHMTKKLIGKIDGKIKVKNCEFYYKNVLQKGAEFTITLPSKNEDKVN